MLGKGIIHKTEVKVKSKINMFPGVVIGEKQHGDIHIKHLGYSDEFDRRNIITTLLDDTYYTNNNVWLFINEENGQDKAIASEAHFEKIGVKYSSVADIVGVYFRNAGQVFEDRTHRSYLNMRTIHSNLYKFRFYGYNKTNRKTTRRNGYRIHKSLF